MPIPSLFKSQRREGFALIIVVLSLTLITVLTIFFLSDVGRERRGVDQYSHGGDSRHLSDTAVNLVMAQISAATKEGTAGTPVSWASQPGMIRTYGADGNLSSAYKLYSWDNLIEGPVSGVNFDPYASSELPSSGWLQLPAQFTDLNAPVNGIYPVADPTIATVTPDPLTDPSTTGQAGSPLVSGSNVPPWDFPEAFSVVKDASKGYYAPAGAASNVLPMPVKWLYILQDGSWVAPTSANANSATFTNTNSNPAPSATNPIVGRIAFWTDDETSKVNINTASEGSFWDTPKAPTQDEMQFAANPPTKNEFQRIAGHPATTSLSAVFPEMRLNGYNRWSASGQVNTTYAQELQDFFNLTPRINQGGSQSGTYPVTTYAQKYAPANFTFTNSAINLDANRLYATADDFWFQPAPLTGTSRVANTAFGNAPTPLSVSQMAKRAFLFTAASRAPETTLFETPRISLWPVTWPYAKASYYANSISGTVRTTPVAQTIMPDPANLTSNPFMTYQERLLAFDSTINTNGAPLPFYFQRQNPDSPTYDWTNIQRNQDLAGYLGREMRQSLPGMGSNLSLNGNGRWGNTTGDWIALNCLDFSRSLVNQYTYNQTTATTSDYQYAFTGLQVSNGRLNNTTGFHYEPNAFSVSPLHVPFNGVTYTTEGAFPALKEACLVFYATTRRVPTLQTTGTPPVEKDYRDPKNWDNLITYRTGGAGNGDRSQTTSMQGVLLLSFSGMAPGVFSARGISFFAPVFWVKVTRLGDSFQVNDTDINLPRGGATGNIVQYSTTTGWAGAGRGGYMAAMPASLFTTAGVTKTFSNGTNAITNWSLVSDPITTDPNTTSFTFKGSKIQVDIYAIDGSGNINTDPTGDPSKLISSQQIDFDAWSSSTRGQPLPLPVAPRWNVKQAAAPTVKMPSQDATYNTLPAAAAVTGWQTEIVPAINQLGQYGPVASPPEIRTRASDSDTSYTIPVTDVTIATEPLIYAYTDTTAGGTLLSPVFQTRVEAIKTHANIQPGNLPPPPYAEGTSGTSIYYGYSQPGDPIQAYQLITPYDTAISMVSDPTLGGTAGDARLMGRGNNSSLGNTGATSFIAIDAAVQKINPSAKPVSVVDNLFRLNTANLAVATPMRQHATDKAQYHSLSTMPGARFPTGYWLPYQYGNAPTYYELGSYGSYSGGDGVPGSRNANDAAVGVDTNVTNMLNANWDWTSLPGNFSDGGFINRPDQDYAILSNNSNPSIPFMKVPYYNDNGGLTSTDYQTSATLITNVFMPNRQIPSPVILGTLPSSLSTGWQTLNFCPNPAKSMNGGSHPGVGTLAATPSAKGPVYTALPDHPLLDLFWMPVAEPYPISDQFSTAGKVNLNYAMMPFPYIQRKTGLDAVLKSVMLAALPTPTSAVPASVTFAKYYKSYGFLYNNGLNTTQTRFSIDVNTTLKAFDYKFSKGDIFRSASQVCDMFLYPNSAKGTDQSLGNALVKDIPSVAPTNITTWWKQHSLTADNVREDPYSAIYSRITTKSNTFTVHWKVQSLKKRVSSDQAVWTENQDVVSSELRGSTLIERYIDPNATNLPDYATDPNARPLSHFYKWRVVSENYFRP